MRRPSLIPDWPRAWRLISVRLAGLALLFGLLPPDQQAAILAVLRVPPERVPAVLGALFMVGRLWAQPGPAADVPPPEPSPPPPAPPAAGQGAGGPPC